MGDEKKSIQYSTKDCNTKCETRTGHESHKKIKEEHKTDEQIIEECKSCIEQLEKNLQDLCERGKKDDLDKLCEQIASATVFLDLEEIVKEGGVIRIASWNLKNFYSFKLNITKLVSTTKIILHYKFDIVALQEVARDTIKTEDGESAIEQLLQQLKKYNEHWDKSCTSEPIGMLFGSRPVYGTFLFNSSVVSTERIQILGDKVNFNRSHTFGRNPVHCDFIIRGQCFALINFHLTPTSSSFEKNETQVSDLHKITGLFKTKNNIILLGDFNRYICTDPAGSIMGGKSSLILCNDKLVKDGFVNLFEKEQITNTSKKRLRHYDSIIIHSDLSENFKSHGVASFPRQNTKLFSFFDHFPIWADLKL